jgi:membrane-associated protein
MEDFVRTAGYLGVFAIIFAESGLLVGFFLPGDSLLFTAGFLASLQDPIFSLPVLLLGCFIAAVAGDSVGYAFGQRVGRKLFQRENSFLFNRKNMLRAEELYEKYGGKTIVIARFIPVVRTFAPIVAGIGSMQYRQFLIYNLLGGSLWAIGVTMAGYFLGSSIPNVDRYLLPIVAIIILISVAPAIYHVLKDQERRQSLMLLVQRFVSRSPVE